MCGGKVYDYGPLAHGLERATGTMTGCTCYRCWWRGPVRDGRECRWIAVLARTTKVLIRLVIVGVIAIAFGILMR